jgi:hypothetical protein
MTDSQRMKRKYNSLLHDTVSNQITLVDIFYKYIDPKVTTDVWSAMTVHLNDIAVVSVRSVVEDQTSSVN